MRVCVCACLSLALCVFLCQFILVKIERRKQFECEYAWFGLIEDVCRFVVSMVIVMAMAMVTMVVVVYCAQTSSTACLFIYFHRTKALSWSTFYFLYIFIDAIFGTQTYETDTPLTHTHTEKKFRAHNS